MSTKQHAIAILKLLFITLIIWLALIVATYKMETLEKKSNWKVESTQSYEFNSSQKDK